MAEKSSRSAIAFLTAPVGGGVIAAGLWMLLKKPCPAGPIRLECAEVLGQTVYNPGGLMTIGAVLGFVVAYFIASAAPADD